MSDEPSFPSPEPFLRHIRACNGASLPGDRSPLFFADEQIGWIAPATSGILTSLGLECRSGFGVPDAGALARLAETLCDLGVYASHHELFDVRNASGDVIGQVDRGALPVLGLAAEGVHMNGLVKREADLFLWVARRSMHKRLDPGKLDHLVAGGMGAGLGPDTTLIKEAQEEAGIPPDLAMRSRAVGRISYALERPEGLRRDVLHCYDLFLPADFSPIAEDGEVESFHLLPIREVMALVRDTDAFKFNVNLVLIDLFIRYGLFDSRTASLLRNAFDGDRS